MRIRLKLDILQQLLTQSALSQNHWAAKFGLSKGHFSNLLSGKHLYPSARTRERMLEILDVEFATLFEIEDVRELPEFSVQSALADRYLIDRQIGQGGMGVVYLARDLRLGRTVAIKIVSAEVVSGVGAKAMLREIINTNRLQHPNILPILDLGEADGSPYYVLPYIRGGSLRDLLQKKRRLSVRQTLSILSGVGSALDYAHAAGVLHCDVKPANILLAGDHAYLIDFGVARVVQSEVWTGDWRGEFDSGAGTPAYVSPEQARGDNDIDGRTDVYSLAGTVYEMLSGEPPFVGDTTLATVAKRFTESAPELRKSVTHIPTELSDAVRTAMAPDRDARTSTAGRLVADCHRAVTTAGTVVGLSLMQASTPRARSTGIGSSIMNMQNIRHSWRTILRSPGVALTIALTLGLGIGVNAVMFRMIDQLFFKAPVGVRAPNEVKRIYVNRTFLGRAVNEVSLGYPALEDLRTVGGFSGVAAFFGSKFSYNPGGSNRRVSAVMATHDFFPVLGVTPALGRFFNAAEDVPGVAGTVVLGYNFWQREFNGDHNVLNKQLRLGKLSYTVVGVAPRGFTGVDPEAVDVFVPLKHSAHVNIGGPWETSRGIQWLRIVARTNPATNDAVIEAAATSRLRAGQLNDPGSRPDPNAKIVIAPLLEARGPEAPRDARISVWLGAVAFILLLITCANVINLLLTRLTFRETEFAIRAALGSGRARLVTAVLTESIMMSLLAGAIGLVVAHLSGSILARLLMPGVEWPSPLADIRVISFTMTVSLVTGIVAGAIPAWQGSRTDVGAALKLGRGSAQRHRSRLRASLMSFQAALSVLLLIGAGLFVRSIDAVRQLDVGLNLDRLLLVTMEIDRDTYPAARALAMQQEAIDRLLRVPGIVGVTGSNSVPFSTSWAERLRIPGVDSIPTPRSGGPYINIVGPSYFEAVGTTMRTGRTFNANDVAGSPRVAIVGETMARLIWREGSPIGHCLKIGADTMPCYDIVGVAKDAPRQSLINRENSQYYVPAAQFQPGEAYNSLFVQTAVDPAKLTEATRRVFREVAPTLSYVSVRPLRDLTTGETRSWRLGATLFTVFGVLALLVAALGLYSVVAYDVAQRTKELGIRIALGVSAANLMRQVFRSGMRPVLNGLGAGGLAALLAARWVEPLLFSTNPRDPLVYGIVGVALLLAACAAIAVPARRALRISPAAALRAD